MSDNRIDTNICFRKRVVAQRKPIGLTQEAGWPIGLRPTLSLAQDKAGG